MKYSKTQKQIIAYFEKNHVLCAQDLLERFSSVNKTTIYRALHKLVSNGVIKELHFSPEQTHYELSSHSHPHIICTVCGKVRELHASIDQVIKEIPHSFLQERVEVNIYGTCLNCQS